MLFLKFAVIVAGICAIGYYKRYGFRQAWYVLRTGDKNPDFEKLDDAEYYLGRKAGEKPRGRFWPV